MIKIFPMWHTSDAQGKTGFLISVEVIMLMGPLIITSACRMFLYWEAARLW